MREQAGFGANDGGCGLNYASDIREAAHVASLAAAIPMMLQIAIRTRHPMSQNLENPDSDHPVMRTLRTNRNRLALQLDEQSEAENTTAARRSRR